MGVMDQVNDMQRRGVSERQIIDKLQEQGISPKEVQDAMSRAQIKNAVSEDGNQGQNQGASIGQGQTGQVGQGSRKGYYDDDLDVPSPGKRAKISNFSSQTQEMGQGQSTQRQQPQTEDQDTYTPFQANYGNYSNDQQGAQEYGYDYGDAYNQNQPGYGYTDTDTMIEISEQVFAEKIKSHLKKIEDAIEFKNIAESKIENISTRLERIEGQIDKLQAAILEKVGGYGRGLENVKKEMKMVEDSFAKMARGLEGKTKKTTTRKTKSKKKTSKKSSKKK